MDRPVRDASEIYSLDSPLVIIFCNADSLAFNAVAGRSLAVGAEDFLLGSRSVALMGE